jgi:hypothetical protein
MKQTGLPVELLETRRVCTADDRPQGCPRAPCGGHGNLLQIKLHDIELSLRGTLQGFDVKAGKRRAPARMRSPTRLKKFMQPADQVPGDHGGRSGSRRTARLAESREPEKSLGETRFCRWRIFW